MDAIYVRQSIDKKDSLSIQGQIDLCRREAGEDFKIYQDKGFSGKNTNRPDFQRMMTDVERGLVEKIVVYRLDRFSRSVADFSRLWEILAAHGVEFVSVSEKFDTSGPMGRAMVNVLITFAQLERETTAQRVRDNYYQRSALGSWPGGPAPYGFSIGREPGPDGKLRPTLVPGDDAPTVERIFRTYAQEDTSLGSVARSLNADGIPAPKRAVWDNVSLSRLLHSPLYVMADEDVYLYYKGKGVQFSSELSAFDGVHGGMIVGKRDRARGKYTSLEGQHFSLSNHFGLIPSELWLRCQDKLDANRQLGSAGKGKHTWLSGLMKCASCGYSVKVNRDGEKYYLVCSGRSNLKLCHQSIRVDLRLLEEEVERELEALLGQCEPPEWENQVNQEAAQAVAHIEQKIDRLMAALSESTDLSMKYINRELERLEQQRARILADQEAQRTKAHRLQENQIIFHNLSFEEKKIVVGQFIQEIRLGENETNVIWKV